MKKVNGSILCLALIMIMSFLMVSCEKETSSVFNSDEAAKKVYVPPGEYELTAWHETLGSLTKSINVGNDGLNINFDFLEIPKQEARR